MTDPYTFCVVCTPCSGRVQRWFHFVDLGEACLIARITGARVRAVTYTAATC